MLVGHAGPVYCTSFNTDNSFLASGSEDGTGESITKVLAYLQLSMFLLLCGEVRLWSLQSYTCLVCFKGHNYPVWSVNFR